MWPFSAHAQVQPCRFLGVGTIQGHSTLSEDEQGLVFFACMLHPCRDRRRRFRIQLARRAASCERMLHLRLPVIQMPRYLNLSTHSSGVSLTL